MRKITHIVVHCSATPAALDIGAAEINDWHVAKGWKAIGYGYIIRRDGTVEGGRDLDKDGDFDEEIGAHAEGFNSVSIGICMIGGMDKANKKAETNFTFQQYVSLDQLVRILKAKHGNVIVLGHRDLPGVAKECPTFNVTAFFGA